ncbi:MAG: hypothetical protein RRY16_01765 [Bacilli bacterium]
MIKKINKFKLLCCFEKGCLSYKKGKLYYHRFINDTPKYIFTLPISFWKRMICQFRITERMFRLEPRRATVLKDNRILITYQGSIYNIDVMNRIYTKEHNYRVGMNNALNFCKYVDEYGLESILYGEYFGNTSKESVGIFWRNNQGKWKKVYEFPSGSIAHIHGISYDKYRNKFLIMTGDENSESAIWTADIDFKQVKVLVRGKQKYRACAGYAVEDGFIYGTDSPIEKNAIYKIRYKTKSEEIESIMKLYDLPGPCIYSILKDDKQGETNMILATSVEPDSSLDTLSYRFTYKLGKGVRDRYCYLIVGNEKNGFNVLEKFKKDNYPIWLFQFGNIQFPEDYKNTRLLLTPIAIKKYDGMTVEYK